jgi:phage FluMu protein Com
MILDIQFTIVASLLTACLIPLYIYREKIFSFKYKTGKLELFLQDLKIHLKQNHPKISFDYSIVEKAKKEKDIRITQTLIVEDMVKQFYNYKYEKNTQKAISKEKIWPGYEEKSLSNPKIPSDWKERRELAWSREKKKCNRCGNSIKLDDAHTTFAKDIDRGGGYNFENIIILCQDCNKVLHNTNQKSTLASLNLNDNLMVFVQS